jgi:hypothetical protein
MADSAIGVAKAKQTGDSHIANLYNPNQYGAEVSPGPKTAARESTRVAEDGFKSLQIDKDALEDALANPTALGGPAEPKSADTVRAAARAESLYLDPKQVEASLTAGKLPDPIAIKKSPWQPDMFTKPRKDPMSPTPMGTVADLQTTGVRDGVEDDWTAAQRAAKVSNPEGLKSLRTPDGVTGVEDSWKAAKRAAEGSKSSEGLAAFRTARQEVGTKREIAGSGMNEKRKTELRRNAEQMILKLRQMIDNESDENELKSMRTRLAQAEKFYDEQFK